MIAGNDGSFSITSSVLADASYTLTVTATDEAGRYFCSINRTTYNNRYNSPSCTVNNNRYTLTNINTPTIEGTAEAGSTVELLNGNNVLGTVIAANDGILDYIICTSR